MRIPKSLLWTLVIVAAIFWAIRWYDRTPPPGSQTITYRIGAIDERFGLDHAELALVLSQAAAVWERAASRDLFRADAHGTITVDLVYDYRQASADKLRRLGARIDTSQASYDSLKAWHDALKADFQQQNLSLAADIRDYHAHRQDLETAGPSDSAADDDARRIDYERAAAEKTSLQARQKELQQTADTLNSMAVVINELAYNLNLTTDAYNRTGKKLPHEFPEGYYARQDGTERITIYHFADRAALVRILAHEMGHALGLPHNPNRQSLMYRLNQSADLSLSPEDLAGLKTRCP